MQESHMDVIILTLGAMFFIVFVSFSLLSRAEKEVRASRVAGLAAFLLAGLFMGLVLLPIQVKGYILAALLIIFLLSVFLFFLPIGKISDADIKPGHRFDERDIMFSRARLQSGFPEYVSYYEQHPERQRLDDLIQSEPGLLQKGTYFYNRAIFAASQGSFFVTEALRNAVEGPVQLSPLKLSPQSASNFVKSLAVNYGALTVGITPSQPYHYYSNIGRGAGTYGEPIAIEHPFAIAFTVEMDYDMVGSNPLAAGVMESGRQYVESAKVAISLAAAIREMGYEARAHIDGNYRVIAPLVARDAGLGELGRMGILITPHSGPRVRLGVVTTTMPLLGDDRNLDPSVIDFCRICKKCAIACPSQSISYEDRTMIHGDLRWQINSETCFHYWTRCGTDCGRCMTVCPYAHQNNLAHQVIRWGIRRSGFFRRVALRMDDLFYGRKPALRKPPDWTQISSED
jgi:ferredoxin